MKKHNRSKPIYALVITEVFLIILLIAPSPVMGRGGAGIYPGMAQGNAITYRKGTQQRIYAFVIGQNNRLYANYWNGSKWQWADQAGP